MVTGCHHPVVGPTKTQAATLWGKTMVRRRKLLFSVFVVLLSVTLATPVFAQKTTGTIRGIVTDTSGAAIVGATVTITNTATGDVRTVKTNEQGEYVAPEMRAGMYEVRAKQPNFKEAIAKDVELNVASIRVVNPVLQVGRVEEAVEVQANTVQVETSTGTVGNVIDGTQVRELPLNGRSFVQLTQLMPGVSPAANFNTKNKGLEAGVDFSVNGNSTTHNLFLVDGVNNNDVGSNRTILTYPSIDAIQEFKILRNSYGPEYGQSSGAVVNLVTRGGTNNFHGTAYYFGRNDVLNAANYFNNLNSLPKDKLRRNDFGYNIGGPLKKDKLFFFWSQEWNRELRGLARSATVPTAAERTGDFSVLRPELDANGNACDPQPTNPVGGAPMTTVPVMSPTGQALVNLFPLPNQANPVNCQNWAQSITSPIYWREESIRADYRISPTWSIMGRYTGDHWSQPEPSTLGFWGDDRYPSVESSWVQPGYQGTVKLTKLFGATAVNDFQVSYSSNRISISRGGTDPALNDAVNAAYTPVFPYSDKLAGTNVGYPVFWGGLGPGANSDNLWTIAPWQNNQELYVLRDDFSKVAGRHTFKVGFLVSNNRKNEIVQASSAENTQFWGVAGSGAAGSTGNGAFNALWAGREWGFDEFQTNPKARTRWHDIEMYVGDTFKATRNLTLEYGVRWSLLRQPYDAQDRIGSFVPSAYDPALGSDACNGVVLPPGGLDFCRAAGFAGGVEADNRSLKEQNNHAFAPRVGFAWDPMGDGKTSVRAGLGQFFQRERLNNYLSMANNSPFSLAAHGQRAFDVVPAGAGTAAPSYGVSTNSDLPNTWQWNLTVEREVFRDSKLELGYVGNRGIHLLQFQDLNPVPASQRQAFALNNSNSLRPFGAGDFGFIGGASWTGNSNYHALQALFRTRAARALEAQFAYTWSKSMGDTDITNSGNVNKNSLLLDANNPRLNYGPTNINRPHNFTANVVYKTPKLNGQNTFVKAVLGDWEAATILSYATGTSMTIYTGRAVDNAPGGVSGTGTSQDNTRPNKVAGQPCRAQNPQFKHQWLNPNRWTVNGLVLGQFGDSPKGDCLGPGIANTDFSIYKNFKVTERIGLQFRMEFFNLFNKVQFLGNSGDADSQLNANYSSNMTANLANNTTTGTVDANFGQSTKTRGPREIQYGLKLTF
jgi:Carboxypeptidase regulatory-like domain/TonB-dependent Receptor Plug Domain